jgi:hypothetical protein
VSAAIHNLLKLHVQEIEEYYHRREEVRPNGEPGMSIFVVCDPMRSQG